ncbi:putative exported protein [Citrobacter rodentium ICC168]|uniref:Exported protein n=1 Tax=Citrobacter rodentium (strain ICC168) TaxID=637910 RepID=D2THS0_CITRI|nr:putative exported protein [Citrobacter rodentium ICC168]
MSIWLSIAPYFFTLPLVGLLASLVFHSQNLNVSFRSIGVRLENGKYPTLSLFF